MIPLRILLEADGKLPELAHARIRGAVIGTISTLTGGLTSGKASVAVIGKLPDGSYALLETSVRLFLNAAAAIRARHGDDGDGRIAGPAEDEQHRELVIRALLVQVARAPGGRLELDPKALAGVTADGLVLEYTPDGRLILAVRQ